MLAWPVVALLGVAPVATEGQPASAPSAVAGDAIAEAAPDGGAYYEFLQARRLEDRGDVEGAVAALERAASLDPTAAEIPAELAALHTRQNQADAAMSAAERALAIDPDNTEAHWVLGIVNAAIVRATRESGQGAVSGAADRAIAHLEKAVPNRTWDAGATLTLSRLYLDTAEHAKAIGLLRTVIDREPALSEAVLLLAEAYEGAGQPRRALATLETIAPPDPQFFRAQVSRAALLEEDGDWRGAADAYGRAFAVNPAAGDIRLRQAMALLSAEDPEAAIPLLEEAAREQPVSSQGLYLLSEAQREAGDLAAAEDTARRLVEAMPQDVRGAYALAQVFEERREYQEIVDVLAPFAEQAEAATRPGARMRTSMLLRLALAKQQTGRVPDALALFERAKAEGPPTALFDAYIAQAYLLDKQDARALRAAREARERWSDDERLIRLEAEALRRTGDLEAAVTLLEAQVDGAPDDVSHVVALGALLARAEAFDRAVDVLTDGRDLVPDDTRLAFELGAVYEQAGREDDAERTFRAVLTRDPAHAPTLNYLGYMFADRGVRLDEAVELLERAVEIDPYNGAYLDSLGWAYFKQRRFGPAREHLQKAAAQLVTSSVVQDHFGDVLYALNDRIAAIQAWERALAGDGESIEPDAIRAKIQRARQE